MRLSGDKKNGGARRGYEKFEGPEFVLDAEAVEAPIEKPRGATAVYFPFDVLEVGRSFTTRRTVDTVRRAIRKFREENGMEREFVARALAAGGCRAWRMK